MSLIRFINELSLIYIDVQIQCFEKPRSCVTILTMTTPKFDKDQRAATYQQEAASLRAIWDATPNRLSQAEFGETYNIGGQSAVGNFLKGASPLSLKAAAGFAKGLGVSIGQFSPRLAEQASVLAEITGGAGTGAAARQAKPETGKRKYLVAIHQPDTEEQIGMVLVHADGLSEAHDRGVRLIQRHQKALNIDVERLQTVVFEIFSMRPAFWD